MRGRRVHRHGGVVHGAGEREVARGQATALGDERGAGLEIEPLGADVAALGLRPLDGDDIAVARGDLLDHHGVGAARHHAAGEDARRLAGPDLAIERPPRRDLADDGETRRRRRHIGGAHRIAVHGGDIGRRLGAQRREIGREHAAAGIRAGRPAPPASGTASASTSASASATESSAMASRSS